MYVYSLESFMYTTNMQLVSKIAAGKESIKVILSSIYSQDDFGKYPKSIQTALKFLKTTDFSKLENGVHEIQGKDIYVQVFDQTSQPIEKTRPECHRKYIDVQFWINGRELVGFAPMKKEYPVAEGIEERDLYFLKGVEDEIQIPASQGDYMIFYPGDIHRPGIAVDKPETYRKAVVKVRADLQ